MLSLTLSVGFISANECTDNKGICVKSCPATYSIKSYSCDGYPVDSYCCTPIGEFPCENTEGYTCSVFDFSSFEGIGPLNYGLRASPLACPYPLFCYKKEFKIYQGLGNYSLSPGDEVHFEGGYIVKYLIFNENASWYGGPSEIKTGNDAGIYLYKGEVNYSDVSQNQIASIASVTNLDKEEIGTFNSGVWFYANPLIGDSNIVQASVSMGSLSSCIDTDSYTVGNTVLELSLGKWGRNYYKKGTATEYLETIDGRTENSKTDSCSNGVLTEYYCDNGVLKSETKNCECADDFSCKKGFFDAISEWIKKTFGRLN